MLHAVTKRRILPVILKKTQGSVTPKRNDTKAGVICKDFGGQKNGTTQGNILKLWMYVNEYFIKTVMLS